VVAGAERLVAEDAIDLDRLVARLSDAGYLRAPVVEDPGSFAVRGGILDVWPPQLETPLRAELYGDLVLSLKAFEPDSQRTSANLAEVGFLQREGPHARWRREAAHSRARRRRELA
jgi:transcription-repair coupling factor (superfamily II helicase)